MQKTGWKMLFCLSGLFLLDNFYLPSTAARLTDVPPFPQNITVDMYQLLENGTRTIFRCASGDTIYGCTAFCTNYQASCEQSQTLGYPYTHGDIDVPVETYYLLDVISQEMSPGVHELTALQAQAITARSYMGWHLNNSVGTNNSNERQVFIPYKFDSLNPTAIPLETNVTDPCDSDALNDAQRNVCDAITVKQYIAQSDSDLPVFAEFSADAYLESNAGDYDYLQVVQDPISYDKGILDIIIATNAHQRGMSQGGANRWAYGNASQYGAGEPWSVRWERVEQILAHYYTGVHLRDAEHSDNILTTHYRWNPLSIDWGTTDGLPPMMEHGNTYPATIPVQNTSIYDWPINGQEWALSYHWARGGFGEVDSDNRAWTTVDVSQGDPPYTFTLSIDDLPAWGPGYYTLQFDVILRALGTNYWFSRDFDWPTFDVRVCVDGCKQVFLPLVLSETLYNAID